MGGLGGGDQRQPATTRRPWAGRSIPTSSPSRPRPVRSIGSSGRRTARAWACSTGSPGERRDGWTTRQCRRVGRAAPPRVSPRTPVRRLLVVIGDRLVRSDASAPRWAWVALADNERRGSDEGSDGRDEEHAGIDDAYVYAIETAAALSRLERTPGPALARRVGLGRVEPVPRLFRNRAGALVACCRRGGRDRLARAGARPDPGQLHRPGRRARRGRPARPGLRLRHGQGQGRRVRPAARRRPRPTRGRTRRPRPGRAAPGRRERRLGRRRGAEPRSGR